MSSASTLFRSKVNSFSIVGAKIWIAFPKTIEDYQSTYQALLFVTLETLDSYADTSTLISEIKKASIIMYNIFLHFLSLFCSLDK